MGTWGRLDLLRGLPALRAPRPGAHEGALSVAQGLPEAQVRDLGNHRGLVPRAPVPRKEDVARLQVPVHHSHPLELHQTLDHPHGHRHACCRWGPSRALHKGPREVALPLRQHRLLEAAVAPLEDQVVVGGVRSVRVVPDHVLVGDGAQDCHLPLHVVTCDGPQELLDRHRHPCMPSRQAPGSGAASAQNLRGKTDMAHEAFGNLHR